MNGEIGNISGMKVITSEYFYNVKIVVKGTADSRRPNTRRPWFRKVVIRLPYAIMIGGTIYCHPTVKDQLGSLTPIRLYNFKLPVGYPHKSAII